MKTTTVVIKKSDGNITSFCIESMYLNKLVTNFRLYEQDIEFIDNYISEYALSQSTSLPSDDGILFIDFVHKIILDSQCVTGINKITPSEIKMSKMGKLVDETTDDNIIKRFTELVNRGYLKGFESWGHSGTHLITDIGHNMNAKEIIDQYIHKLDYGQFAFLTNGMKVTSFLEHDYEEQTHLFSKIKELNLINDNDISLWTDYIRGLK